MFGRKVQKNNSWDNLSGFRYAHRGLFHEPRTASLPVLAPLPSPLWQKDIDRWKEEGKKIVPENTMQAFRIAVKHGFGSELDVHLTRDGMLPVFHDTSMLRMCGIQRQIEDMTREEIASCRLLDTDARIPELSEVLDLYTSERALTERTDARGGSSVGEKKRLHLPLIIELKAEKNVKQLCEAVMEVIDRYPDLNYCIESFDPRVVYWFRRHRPEVIRGQLTENFCRSRDAVRQWGYVMTFGMWCGVPDILSRPDFISSKFRDRKNLVMLLRHRLGVRQVNWTIKNHRQLADVDREGGLSIFERFFPGERDGKTDRY